MRRAQFVFSDIVLMYWGMGHSHSIPAVFFFPIDWDVHISEMRQVLRQTP